MAEGNVVQVEERLSWIVCANPIGLVIDTERVSCERLTAAATNLASFYGVSEQ